jgi:F420-dependent oxidoreductase-like protein
MRLGLNLGYWGASPLDHVPLAREAERLGYHSLWTAEAWGSDAVTTLTWVAAKTDAIQVGTAIMQIPARTPANTAMTAATLDALTGGRMILGLGASGPQVAEGWHGVPYGRPLRRTREYVEIVRAIWERRRSLEYHGEHYDIPITGGTGLGRPLKLIFHPVRRRIPIYIAAIGPKNIALAAEIADGWLPIFFAPQRKQLFREPMEEGFIKAGPGKDRSAFDIAPTVQVEMGSDLASCRESVKPNLAFYIGCMGAKGRNFYYDLACRYGYEESCEKIRDFYLDGRKIDAEAAVPDSLVDEVALCGSRERIADRMQLWREAGVTTLICSTRDITTLRAMAEIAL